MRTRLLIVCGRGPFVEAVCQFIEADATCEVLGRLGDTDLVIRTALSLQPDITLIDTDTSYHRSLALIHELATKLPSIRILTLGMYTESSLIAPLLGAGASGYVLKDSVSDELLTAIQTLTRGRSFLSDQLTGNNHASR